MNSTWGLTHLEFVQLSIVYNNNTIIIIIIIVCVYIYIYIYIYKEFK